MNIERLMSYSTAVIVFFWFASYSVTFAILPDEGRWFYILFFPFLIGDEVVRRWRDGRLRLRINPFEWAIVAYFVYVGISLYNTDVLPLSKDVYAVEFLFRVATPIFLYAYVRLRPLDSPQIRAFSLALVVLVIVQTVFGFISLQIPTLLPTPYQPRPVHIYSRATGTYGAPEAYAFTLLFALVFIFYQSLQAQNQPERRWWWIVVIIAIIGAVISRNRNGWLNLGILLTAMMLLDRRFIRWVFGLFVVGVVGTLLLFPGFIEHSFERLGEWRQIESRIIMNSAGFRMMVEEPLFGRGYGTYDLYDWEYMQPVGQMEATNYELATATSHNTYLTILVETGLVGLILYLLPTLYFLSRTVSDWDSVDDKAYLILLWMLILIVQIAGQIADLRFFPFILAYWWFALALIANTLDASPTTERA